MTDAILQAEQELKAAERAATAARAKLDAPQAAVEAAKRRLQDARDDEARAELGKALNESSKLAAASAAANQTLLSSIQRHDMDGSVAAFEEVLRCWKHLADLNWKIVSKDRESFGSLPWSTTPGLCLVDALSGTKGKEFKIRAGIIYVLTDGQDASRWNLVRDTAAATKQAMFEEARRKNFWY